MNTEKTDTEPTLLLPDVLPPEIVYEVIDIGALVPSRTATESGHFDVRIHVAPLRSVQPLLREAPRGPLTTIQVPCLLLPHVVRGTLWQNRMKFGEILCPQQQINVTINDHCIDTITGTEIFDRHFVAQGQRLAAAVELAVNPELSGHFSEDFLKTAFVHIPHGNTDYYAPCDVLFNACFYGSYLIASNILAGNFEAPRNLLYHPSTSGWEGPDYVLDARRCAPASDELAIARLVCRARGLNTMRDIRTSLQNQIRNSGHAFMRAHFPFSGPCRFAVRGRMVSFATGNCFFITRIVSATVPPLFDRLKVVRDDYDSGSRSEELGELHGTRVVMVKAAPEVSVDARLTPDSEIEGKSSQRTARIEQSELDGSWLTTPVTKVLIKTPKSAQRATRRIFEEPDPLVSIFSTALIGSSPKGIPRAGQGPSGLNRIPLESLGPANNSVGARFRAIVLALDDQRGFICSPIRFPSDVATLTGNLPAPESWIWISDEHGQTRPRHLYHVIVSRRRLTYRDEKPCLIVDYERGPDEPAPHPFYVVFPKDNSTPERWVESVIHSLVAYKGRLMRSHYDFHLIREQDNVVWKRKGWGEGKEMHHAFKAATAIRRFWCRNGSPECQSPGIPEANGQAAI